MEIKPKFDFEKLLTEAQADDLLARLQRNIRISQDEIRNIIKKKRVPTAEEEKSDCS